MSDEKLSPVLEAPPSPEIPSGEMGELITETSVSTVSSKLMLTESMLHLVTRDYKFHDFMREILISILKVIKAEAGSILEIDQKNKVLFFRAVAGSGSDRLPQFIVPIGQGVVGYVAEAKQPLVVNKVQENKIYLKAIEKAVDFEAKNLVAVPILIRGQVFGVLELLNRYGAEEFSLEDVELLTYACEMASKAIEARLVLGWAIQNSNTGKELAA